jgi:hypothetical protein
VVGSRSPSSRISAVYAATSPLQEQIRDHHVRQRRPLFGAHAYHGRLGGNLLWANDRHAPSWLNARRQPIGMLQLAGGVGVDILLEPRGQQRHGHLGMLCRRQKTGALSGAKPVQLLHNVLRVGLIGLGMGPCSMACLITVSWSAVRIRLPYGSSVTDRDPQRPCRHHDTHMSMPQVRPTPGMPHITTHRHANLVAGEAAGLECVNNLLVTGLIRK